MPDPETTKPDDAGRSALRLTQWHRRLARYMYLDDMIRGRRVLELGCGEGRSAAFLAQRGAGRVIGFDSDGESIARGQTLSRHDNLSLRHVARAQLSVAGGMGEDLFDLILLAEDAALLRSDDALRELKRILQPGGHLIVAVPSKEAMPDHPGAISYFDLLDRLDKVGQFGPVTMLGQTPFLATTMVPFGVDEPELVMDDSLTVQEPPEEYVAICGPPGKVRPYQVIQLPKTALEQGAAPARDEAAFEKMRVAAEKLVSERGALQAEVGALREQAAAAQILRERLATDLSQAAVAQKELSGRLKDAELRLQKGEAQVSELRDLLSQRERGSAEQVEAARLFEQKLRELRGVLEERDAFITELEAQQRGVEEIKAQVASAVRRAEQAESAERASRLRLAAVEGVLLRTQTELAMSRQGGDQAGPAAPPEEAFLVLGAERQALEGAQRALAEDRQALARGASEVAHLREQLELERQRTARERDDVKRDREQLERDLQARGGERTGDVPVPVGDLPTAPHVSFTPPTVLSPQEEVSRLQGRISELEGENGKLKEKASEAERESWKYMKARSDAEAQAAEVRDDAARKLRDARKLASVELTRAMEEATKKAIALREELTRAERERKDALSQTKELRAARDAALRQADALRQELEALRWSTALLTPAMSEGPEGDAEVHREVARAREEGAAAVLTVRAEAERAIADERSARQGAEEVERRTGLRFEELRTTVLQLELQLGESRDAAEAERRRVETLQEEVRRLTDEAATRQREAEAELGRTQLDLVAKDRSISELRVEREALGRLLQEVEREAYSRAERARDLRTRMLERDREVEALRVELLDRDRKITVLEKQQPLSEEIGRLEADLQAARARLQELEAERGRQDAASDEAVATALRERARAARLTESLQQASRERDEAQNRVVELEQRLQAILDERNRLRSEAGRLDEIVRRTQSDAQQLGERLKQTRRELEAEEKRATREAERAQAAADLGRLLDEARDELAGLRVRTLEVQAELAKSRAELAQKVVPSGVAAAPIKSESTEAESAPIPPGHAGPPRQKTPLLKEHTVRRVLALGQALGLEPLSAPRPGDRNEEAGASPPAETPAPVDPEQKN